ncbi:MAG: UDP-N-acetylglucosamine--N-acetylmuramyl-(pentapeptide) pyrophosphoryl-undecaprenol N-acetylglucosamine transferase [Candidatus Dojkabacteria bacterium]
MSKKSNLILFTGGHATPALAVISELKKRGYTNFLWVGHKYNQQGNTEVSPEFKLVEEAGIKFIDLKTGKLNRKWTLQNFLPSVLSILMIFYGFIQSKLILLRNRPAIVVSFGGYLAVPVVIIAWVLRIKIITHEQTIVTGLANKIISKFANKVCISWESSKQFFPSNKTVLTGNPIRREVFKIESTDLIKDLDPKKPTLYITGGNQGAHEINKRVFEYLPNLLQECNIIHQTGNSTATNDYQKAIEMKKELPGDISIRYVPVDYVKSNEIGAVFNKADVIFSRSGANTITELLALGKLSILMPIPWTSGDEQTKNARILEETGLGFIIIQKDNLTSKQIYQTILLSLNQIKTGKGFNGRSIDECIEVASSKIILDAPQKVVDVIEGVMS